MTNLLPCPAGHADPVRWPGGEAWKDFAVDCSHAKCGWVVRGYDTQAEADAAWNNRGSGDAQS